MDVKTLQACDSKAGAFAQDWRGQLRMLNPPESFPGARLSANPE
jgi:hypothetical protein